MQVTLEVKAEMKSRKTQVSERDVGAAPHLEQLTTKLIAKKRELVEVRDEVARLQHKMHTLTEKNTSLTNEVTKLTE